MSPSASTGAQPHVPVPVSDRGHQTGPAAAAVLCELHAVGGSARYVDTDPGGFSAGRRTLLVRGTSVHLSTPFDASLAAV